MKPIKLYLKSIVFFLLLLVSSMPLYASSSLLSGYVLIVRSADTAAYLEVERSFRAQLSQHMTYLIGLKSVSLDSPQKLNTLFLAKAQQKTDFIITIGAKAAHEVLSRSPDVSVLSVFVPRRAYRSIMAAVSAAPLFSGSSNSRSVIYLDQPDERLVLLAKLLAKKSAKHAVKVSLFSGADSLNNGFIKARQCAGKNTAALMSDVNVYRQMISSRSLKRTLKRSDVIIATPEMVKQSPNSVKWLLYMAYQRNIPVVGYSKAFVDAGALAAVYSTPEDIGRQTAEAFLSTQSGENSQVSMYPSYFHVSVNQTVAEALDFSPQGSMLNSEQLRKSLIESALNCEENSIPLPTNEIKQQMSHR